MERRVLSQVGADLVSRTDQMEALQWDMSTQAADSLGRWGVEERTRKEVVEKNRPTCWIFKKPTSQVLKIEPSDFPHVGIWGEDCHLNSVNWLNLREEEVSSLFFSSILFLLFFLSAFNCHLYFLWEPRNLLFQLRGTGHGKDKEKKNTFRSPWVTVFLLLLSPLLLIIHHHPFSLFTYPLVSMLMSLCYS